MEKKRKHSVFPSVLCRVLGTLILLGVIVLFLPMTAPRLLGYQVYNVVSGSMEPAIPMGSLILVDATPAEELTAGDVAAFDSGGSVVAHRVKDNHLVEGELITQGDANEEADFTPVPYASVRGKVVRHVAYLGGLMELLASPVGKVYAGLLTACGVMFHMLAARLWERSKEDM
jgi:signal peptidase I